MATDLAGIGSRISGGSVSQDSKDAGPSDRSDHNEARPYRSGGKVEEAFSDFVPTPKERMPRRRRAAILAVTAAVLALDFAMHSRAEAYFVLICVPAGLEFLFQWRLQYGHYRRLRAARCTPVREVLGGNVGIRGRVVASDRGLFVAPRSGERVVWARVRVSVDFRGDGTEIVNETAARDFLIDDGSGEMAYVDARNARIVSENLRMGTTEELSPGLRAFVCERARDFQKYDGWPAYISEVVIGVGDEVIAVGPSRRAVCDKEGDASASTSRLVLGSAAGELVVGAWPQTHPLHWHEFALGLSLLMFGVGGSAVFWWFAR
jgi:hypothetical protein